MERKHKEEERNKEFPHRKMSLRRSLERMRRNVPLLVFIVEDSKKTGEVCCAYWMIEVDFDTFSYTPIIIFGGWWMTCIDFN